MTYDEIKNMLSLVSDPATKMEMVMDFGAHIAPVPDDAICSEITGCASRVEICRVGNRFFATADSAIVRGIVAIIISMVDGRTPEEIRQMDLLGMFMALNIKLGSGRLNGVNSMIRFFQNL